MSAPTPHDSYFRQVMNNKEHAKSEVREAITAKMAKHIDWNTFELQPGTFISEELQSRFTDVLYRTRISGRDGYIYTLIEHQSSNDHFMALRMLEYTLAIWKQHLTEHDHKHTRRHGKGCTLPIVIPIVIHNNPTGRRWSAPTQLFELYGLSAAEYDAFGPHLPQLKYLLDDVAVLDVTALRARKLTPQALVLFVLQQLPPGSEAFAHDLVPELSGFTGQNQFADLSAVITYIMAVADIPESEIAHVFEQLGPGVKEYFMTTAERIEARGEARGRVESLLQLMTLKYGPLTPANIERVQQAGAADIHEWTARVLTASTVNELFA